MTTTTHTHSCRTCGRRFESEREAREHWRDNEGHTVGPTTNGG